jgi:hypothetical protein
MRPSNRRARATVATLAAALALVTVIGPVAASAPQAAAQGVTIVSPVTFDPNGNHGTFTTSGPATDGGLICGSGTFFDTSIHFAGLQAPTGYVQLQVVKQFTCAAGTGPQGTFSVKLQINANFNTGIESFSWVAQGLTGDLEGLNGAGRGSTVPTNTGNINTYIGVLVG